MADGATRGTHLRMLDNGRVRCFVFHVTKRNAGRRRDLAAKASGDQRAGGDVSDRVWIKQRRQGRAARPEGLPGTSAGG